MVGDWDGNGLTLLISALLRLKAAAPACTAESPAWTRLITGSFFCGRWSGACRSPRDKNLSTDGAPRRLSLCRNHSVIFVVSRGCSCFRPHLRLAESSKLINLDSTLGKNSLNSELTSHCLDDGLKSA